MVGDDCGGTVEVAGLKVHLRIERRRDRAGPAEANLMSVVLAHLNKIEIQPYVVSRSYCVATLGKGPRAFGVNDGYFVVPLAAIHHQKQQRRCAWFYCNYYKFGCILRKSHVDDSLCSF